MFLVKTALLVVILTKLNIKYVILRHLKQQLLYYIKITFILQLLRKVFLEINKNTQISECCFSFLVDKVLIKTVIEKVLMNTKGQSPEVGVWSQCNKQQS